jgi:hypothetical protein
MNGKQTSTTFATVKSGTTFMNLVEALGPIKARARTPARVERRRARCTAVRRQDVGATLEAKWVADRHMILHSMYKFGTAKSRRVVDHNPCLETQPPTRRKKPPKGAALTEWRAMYEAAQAIRSQGAPAMARRRRPVVASSSA